MGSNNNLNWEAKYKSCRAAFVETCRIYRQNEREQIKFLQRLQQLAFDGLKKDDTEQKDEVLNRLRCSILSHIKERLS